MADRRSFAIGQNALASRKKLLLGLFLILFSCVFFGNQLSATSVAHADSKLENKSRAPRVLLVSMPRVSWKSLEGIKTPNIDALGNVGSVANLSIRVTNGSRNLEKGYATISAGHRASTVASESSTFYQPNEMLGGYSAKDIFREEQGKVPSGSAALSLGFELSRNKSDNDLSPARIGSFGSAIQDAGKSIAAFGNTDTCADEVVRCRNRSIGYVASNTEGVVARGNVSREMLDSTGMLDMSKVKVKASQSIEENDVTVVECSNIERAELQSRKSSEELAQKMFKDAVLECDQLIGKLKMELDFGKDQIYIVSPMSSSSNEELTLFLASGKEIQSGFAVSGITRRSGIVALADIAPSILDFLEIDPPDEMVDTLLAWDADGASLASRKNSLIQTNERALLRDKSFNLVATLFILVVFFGVVLSVVSYKKYSHLMPVAKALSLVSLMMPTSTFLLLPFMLNLKNPIFVALAFLMTSGFFALVAYWCARKWGYSIVVLFVSAISLIFQLFDILFGGNFQLNSLFGYSAIVAGRFAGFGNLTFSIVSISTVLVVASVEQLSLEHKNWNSRTVNFVLVGLMVFVLVVVGAPYFGSDVGGVLALTPTVVITGLMLFERKIGFKSFVAAGLITIVSISVFSLFDLNRPASERTHLGRFVEVLVNGDAGVVIEGKIISNLNILTNSVIASVVVISTIFLMFLFLYPERFISENSRTHPVFRYIAYPGMVVAILGMFLNDSGAAIPGMMMALAFPAAMLLISEMKVEISQEKQSNTTLNSESV